MTIHDLFLKFKDLSKNTDILLSILIVVISHSSFALGRYSAGEDATGTINSQQKAEVVNSTNVIDAKPIVELEEMKAEPDSIESTGGYVASKNGTKYHLPWCGGAKQIKESNKVFFKTKEEAEKAGYTPASNCKGI